MQVRARTARERRAMDRGRRGSVLVVALMAVMGVAMLAACLLQFSVSMTRNQIQSIDEKRAFYLAEAGLSEAVYGLSIGKSGQVGRKDVPAQFGDGLVWVEALQSLDGRVALKSTGLCGGGRAALSIVIEKAPQSVASLGVFSNSALTVKSGSSVDSYDSSGAGGGLLGGLLGGLSLTPGAARVGSNGNITLQGTSKLPTKIDGDATPGANGLVSRTSGVTITGSTTPRSEAVPLPEIEAPSLASLGTLKQTTKTGSVPSGEHRYDAITVEKGTLTVVGPQTLVVGSLVIQKTASLVLDATRGAIQIYVTDYLNLASGSTFSTTSKDPAQVSLVVTASRTVDRNGDGVPDPPATLGAAGDFYGMIYAPAAALALNKGLQVFGAIAAESLTLTEAKVHFDQALASSSAGPTLTRKLLSWRVVDLPDTQLVSMRIDPVAVLKLQGVAVPKPSVAHQNIEFKARFFDQRGKEWIWKGEEAYFDYSQVSLLVAVKRLLDPLFNLLW